MIVSGKGNFVPAPAGVHHAVCVDVIDLGIQPSKFGPQHKCKVVWQIEKVMKDTGKRFIISQFYNATLGKKANLRNHLVQWRGREFTDKELAGFELEKLIGAPCQLVVTQVEKDGEKYSNITAITPADPRKKLVADKDYVRMKDRPENTNPPAPSEDDGPPPSDDDYQPPADSDDVPF